MAIDNKTFKNALKLWASGVAIVTSDSKDGVQGMTATSFTSVSMDPPQILVCLHESATTGEAVLAGKSFAVNLLTANQEIHSNQFAGASSMEERFEALKWSKGELGHPIFDEALVSLECTVVQQVKAGTHWVVIGEVQKTTIADNNTVDPLLYFNGGYAALKS